MKIHAYVRVSTDKQETENQRGEIRRYVEIHKLPHIDEWHDINMSTRKSIIDRKLDLLVESINKGDILIVSELSRLGRSLSQLTNIVNEIIKKKKGRIIFLKQNMDLNPENVDDPQNKVMLTMFALFAEIERDFISLRIKEALKTKKDNGQVLGRKKGSIIGSKYDKYAGEIINLLNQYGKKWTVIISVLKDRHGDEFDGTRQSLATWVKEKCSPGLGNLWTLKA